ncbi:TetR family transcriptional regulator [Rhodococcus hoagii]|nr:TetR family transcriptional regulator [Prescottella equi]
MKRRGEYVTQAVHAATIELLTNDPDTVSIAEIGRRADVHRASIYRRWKTLDNLITDAILHRVEFDVPVPDTGSARDDLVEFLRTVRRFVESPVGHALARLSVTPTISAEASIDRRALWNKRFDDATAIVQRGIERRELRPDTDADTLITLATAAIHLESLTEGTQPVIDIEVAIDLLWRGVAAS